LAVGFVNLPHSAVAPAWAALQIIVQKPPTSAIAVPSSVASIVSPVKCEPIMLEISFCSVALSAFQSCLFTLMVMSSSFLCGQSGRSTGRVGDRQHCTIDDPSVSAVWRTHRSQLEGK
jgi:hypothetical protein